MIVLTFYRLDRLTVCLCGSIVMHTHLVGIFALIQILMESRESDERDINSKEVMRRYLIARPTSIINDTPDLILPLIRNVGLTIPLYKTSLTDPIDAIVELMCKIIPETPAAELVRRAEHLKLSESLDDLDEESITDLAILKMCGINGIEKDTDDASVLFKLAAAMPGTRSMRATGVNVTMQLMSATVSPYNRDLLPMVEDLPAEKVEYRKWLWLFLDAMCAVDYVCPISLLAAGEASYWPEHISDDVKAFITRHPECVELYHETVSLPCGNPSCMYHYCEPGVLCRCDKCNMPYCSLVCRDNARATHVCNGTVHAKMAVQSVVDPPRSYASRILSMFGIHLQPLYEPSTQLDVQFSRIVTFVYSSDPRDRKLCDALLEQARGYAKIGDFKHANIILYHIQHRMAHAFAFGLQLQYFKIMGMYALGDYFNTYEQCRLLIERRYSVPDIAPSVMNDMVNGCLEMMKIMPTPSHDYMLVTWSELDADRYECCCICQSDIQDLEDQRAVTLKCKHALCCNCICTAANRALTTDCPLTCPMCRETVPDDILQIVARQYYTDNQATGIQSLLVKFHVAKARDVVTKLMVHHHLNVTETYMAIFTYFRLVTPTKPTASRKVMLQYYYVRMLTLLFRAAVDTSAPCFVDLRSMLTLPKTHFKIPYHDTLWLVSALVKIVCQCADLTSIVHFMHFTVSYCLFYQCIMRYMWSISLHLHCAKC